MNAVIEQINEMAADYAAIELPRQTFSHMVLCGYLSDPFNSSIYLIDVYIKNSFKSSKYLISVCIKNRHRIRILYANPNIEQLLNCIESIERVNRDRQGYCSRTRQYFNSIEIILSDSYKQYICGEMDYKTNVKWKSYMARNYMILYYKSPEWILIKEQFLEDKHTKLITCLISLSKTNEHGPHHGSMMRRRIFKYTGLKYFL